MRQIKASTGQTILVDDIDSDLLDDKWMVNERGYARHTRRKNRKFIHRLIGERIAGRPLIKGEVVDHINRDKLDNSRTNLRVVTQRENNRNNSMRKDNSTGYTGVYKSGKKFFSVIQDNYKQKYLGMFSTKIEAYEAYKAEVARIDAIAAANLPV